MAKSTIPIEAADLIESLQAQLAESQRRERAAVRDLKYLGDCTTCRHNQYPCEMEDAGHECWQWRGQVED